MNESEPLATESTTPDTTAAPAPESASAASEAQQAAPDLSAQLVAAKKEAAENYDRYVRSVADMDNFRRRTVREKEELRQFAASKVLEDLLPVLDNLGLGLAAAKAPNADLKTLVGGISMVADQLKNSLSGHGLKEINPLGQPFDPNLHEAISQQANAEVAEGSVITVVRTGFSLNGRLLRPASVIVSTGAASTEAKA
ncbi:MAG TPA: nucleotide exchange factor GrpE [Rariglobus sp.]|jgi:molecular chaperone GrpE|nr:nucleotide exchange factor GrpE [Rariglobus sp.]